MSKRIRKHTQTWKQRLKEFTTLCQCAADGLGISEGEFWVWYGRPFILQSNLHK